VHRDRRVSNPIVNQSTNQSNASFRKQLFLTEVGIYRLMYRSRSAINATCQTLRATTSSVECLIT